MSRVGSDTTPQSQVGRVVVSHADLHIVNDDIVLLGLVASIDDRQFDGVVVVERREVIVTSFVNIDIRPLLLDISGACWFRWNVSVGADSFHLVVDRRVEVTGVVIDAPQVRDRNAMRPSRKSKLSI